MRYHWFLSITLSITALWSLFTSFRVFLTKRPFIYPARITFFLIQIVFLPLYLDTIEVCRNAIKNDLGLNLVDFMFFLFFVFLYGMWGVFLWRRTHGYVVVGVTDEVLRKSLRCTLNDLGIDFEESSSGFWLTASNKDLFLNTHGWTGIGTLELKGANSTSVLKDIVKSLHQHFVSSPPKVNIRAGTYGAAGSLALIVLAIVAYVWWIK
jgi:hypothetical protein